MSGEMALADSLTLDGTSFISAADAHSLPADSCSSQVVERESSPAEGVQS